MQVRSNLRPDFFLIRTGRLVLLTVCDLYTLFLVLCCMCAVQVIAALLGAEEYAFSTAPLIAMGCIMMR